MKFGLAFIASVLLQAPAFADTPFYEGFSVLDSNTWTVETHASPGKIKGHSGFYATENVFLTDGYLVLKMDQQTTSDGSILSIGGLIKTNQRFGYGTYEFRARFASTSSTPMGDGDRVSGGTSAAFIYADGAATEIDVELEGYQDITHVLSWEGEDVPNEHSKLSLDGPPAYDGFYTYRIEWSPKRVKFYRDDQLIATHTEVVPSEPGYITFNHWGTNSEWWGGYASVDQPRYMYVDYVKFTPHTGVFGTSARPPGRSLW